MGALVKSVGALIVAALVILFVVWLGSALVPEREVSVARLDLTAQDRQAAAPKPLSERLPAADIEKGARTAKQCAACHTFGEGQASRIGPNLYGIVWRVKASLSGFAYSDALKEKGGVWTYEDLDGFLAAPKDFVPKTKMAFVGLKKPEDRANVIAYLHSLSPYAPPLPGTEPPAIEDDDEDAQEEE